MLGFEPAQHSAADQKPQSLARDATRRRSSCCPHSISKLKQKKSKQAAVPSDLTEPITPEIPADEILFSKQYYPISEVAALALKQLE
jgi:hypothetical protein